MRLPNVTLAPRKLAAYRAADIQKLISCVADDLACNESDLPVGARVLRYRRAVDAAAVLAVVDSDSSGRSALEPVTCP